MVRRHYENAPSLKLRRDKYATAVLSSFSPPFYLLNWFNPDKDKTGFERENNLKPKQAVAIYLNGTGPLCPNELQPDNGGRSKRIFQ